MDHSAPTTSALTVFQPKTEFKTQLQQAQALNMFSGVKLEPVDDTETQLKNHKTFRHGKDPEAKRTQLNKFPDKMKPSPGKEYKWRCHRDGCDAELASKEDLQNHLASEHKMEQEGQGLSRAGLQTTGTREHHLLGDRTAGTNKEKTGEERKLQIYLWPLPVEGISNEEIKQHFDQYGPVDKVKRPCNWMKNNEPRNYGFVTFHQEETAQDMLKKGTTTINGHRIEIKEVRSKENGNRFAVGRNNARDLRSWLQRGKRQPDGTTF